MLQKPCIPQPHLEAGYRRYPSTASLTAAAELYGLGKMPALLADGTTRELKGTIDVNLSAVYRYNNLFNIFLEVNNIAGIKYERYLNYPSYGFNMLGGLSFSF